jgi:hypothetical protein
MAQSLEVNIKTTSDVPKAMDKAKAAVTGFDKQVQDIGKKFSTAFKDIALGFVAPMVIVQNILGMIKADIDKAKQDAKDGLDLIAKGDTQFATSQQKRQASFVQYRIAQQEEEQKVRLGAQKIYEEFLNTREGQGIYNKYLPQFSGPEGEATMFTISEMAQTKKVRDEIEAWFKDNQDKLIVPGDAEKTKSGDFKGPQGFSNIVGVGANPVMEAMNQQLEEQKKQTNLLQNLVDRNPFGGADFTKPSSGSSRGTLSQ